MILEMYRMFEVKDGEPHTLFHGVEGSRRLSLDQWIIAEQKQVRDGRGKTYYESGFHVFEDLNALPKFLARFKYLDQRVICKVLVDTSKGLWDKAHSPFDIKLAKAMFIPEKEWDLRISAEYYKEAKDVTVNSRS